MPEFTVTPADSARLMLNRADSANRFVEFNGRRYPILHMGIGDLERFRAAIVPLEQLYLRFSESELSVVAFIRIFSEEILGVFKDCIPQAAAIVLGVEKDFITGAGRPVEALGIVVSQWLHNTEIGKLQAAFPHPDSEAPDPDDPNAGNPMTIVERLASAYHWPFEEALKRTVPQIYLMGVSSAWSYEKIKSESNSEGPSVKPKPIAADGKKRKNFKGMTPQQYREYLAGVMGGMDVPNVGQVNPIGGA